MNFRAILKSILTWGLLAALLISAGCASQAKPDPFESYNRKVFKFNLFVDKILYRPVAKSYDTVTPKVVQHGVTNFFSNVGMAQSIANDLLQFNIPWAVEDTWRLFINTTVGVGGLFDVAKHYGLEKRTQDFGLTLAFYGIKNSPYFILPLLPPATIRDLFGQGVDLTVLSPWAYVRPIWIGYAAYGLDFTNRRAALLGTDKLVKEAFDPYLFVRDAYLQKRNAEVRQILHPNKTEEELEPDVFEDSSNEPLAGDEEPASSGASNTKDLKQAAASKP